ncbi:ammonium transporter 3 member 1 [Canna indica]|uniref:Ammonium transporter 3 member 1 n=1 Tax=Canna indica TaxID=4628 RepID=A0AAQ3JYS1_9LILI|nr:ammonium transporter 3 member 1 [Canna indica]
MLIRVVDHVLVPSTEQSIGEPVVEVNDPARGSDAFGSEVPQVVGGASGGFLGGPTIGLYVEPILYGIFLPVINSRDDFYGDNGGMQVIKQIVDTLFIVSWNVVVTSIDNDVVHGEEAYALWGAVGRRREVRLQKARLVHGACP